MNSNSTPVKGTRINCLNKFIFFIVLFCSVVTINAQAVITGGASICNGQTATYSVPSVYGETYSWSLTGPGNISGAANNSSVIINWDSTGNATVSVVIDSNNHFTTGLLNVTIHPIPNPLITWPAYPTCPSNNTRGNPGGNSSGQGTGSNPCINVCKNSTITYSTPLDTGSIYIWIVSGASSFTGQNTNSITVNWDTTSLGQVTVVETNSWGCVDSNTVCIQKVDVPVALFSTQSNVCLNAVVNFNNLSTGATSYQWYFGDGGSSTAFDPSHSYSTGGTYTITLIAMNACHCSDTFRSSITVSSEPGPDIECPSTVCAGDTETYYTGATCGVYNWSVTGGTIISGLLTPSITVAWGAGMIGQVSLYITGCGSLCSDTTTVTIPIIPSIAAISGPILVCPGDCHTYSLPLFSGSVYAWSISGSAGGYIAGGNCNCCNGIQICWPSYSSFGSDTLNVSYFDSFLNCGGTGQLIIYLRPQVSLYAGSQACVNSQTSVSASSGISCNWTISPAGPTFTGNGTSNIIINWNGMAGTYTITAVATSRTASCNDSATAQITVVPIPPAPVITGDTIICPNNTYSYCSNSNNVTWIITGGTPASGLGNCINVQWANTGPYEVQAVQIATSPPYCTSDTTTQMVNSVPPASAPVISGPLTVCSNGSNTFINTTAYPAFATFNWTISPANEGSILSGQGTDSVKIQWGNNASLAVITLTVTVCSQTLSSSQPVHLFPAPNPSIVVNGLLCAGDSVTLSATGGSLTAYQWGGPGGFSSNTNPSSYITMQGFYQLTVTDANNCTGLATQQVNNVPGPVASISTSDQTSYCIGNAFSVQLNALANPNYTYNWSNGNTGNPISVSVAGTYTVTITNQYGCTALSNAIIIIVDSCIGNGNNGPPCVPSGTVSFIHPTFYGCNPVSFTNTSSANASDFYWTFGNGASSGATNPTYTYPLAGFYLVTLTGTVPSTTPGDSCVLTDTAQVKIPLAPAFSFIAGCPQDSVCFTDLSTFTPGDNITSWAWNFGDSQTSNFPNPCHKYATGGTYIVTLTVGNGTCTSTVTDTVVLLAPPTAAFTFTNPSCVNSNVSFTDLSTPVGTINSWAWAFGDGGTSLNQNPDHSYSLPGTYIVQLIVSNKSGCVDTTYSAITIIAPNVTGNITAYPDTVVCAGSNVLLVAPACAGCTYLWSNTATTDSTIAATTGIYSVSVTSINGCQSVFAIHIVITPAPPVTITNYGSAKLCLGSNTFLSGLYSSNYLYYWISNDITNNGNTNSGISVVASTAGVYYYTLSVTDTSTGCSDTTLPYIITVNDTPAPPVITALGPTTFCQGNTVTLVATPPSPFSIQWSNGDIGDTIYAAASGCYSAMVSDTNGCNNSATICDTVNSLPATCAFWTGCLDTCNPFTIRGPSGDAAYQWLLNGVPIGGATSQNYTATLSGTYSLILTNSYGCTDTTGNLNLTLHSCPTACVDIINDTVYCDGQGNYIFKYYIINNSGHTLNETTLLVLPPNLSILYGPVSSLDTILTGDTSALQTDTIYGPVDSNLCFIVRVQQFDNWGEQMFCCNSDTVCITLPPCKNCCYLNILSDSVWCTGVNAAGLQTYSYKVVVEGCGTLVLQTTNYENDNTLDYTLTADSITVINGTFTQGEVTEGILCFTFVMVNANAICADTTICLQLPNCNNCCNLGILSDSVWCAGINDAGVQTYGYQVVVTGCGTLVVQTNNQDSSTPSDTLLINPINVGLTANSTYTLTAGSPLTITGSYTLGQGNDSTLCFTFIMESAAGLICADTTICLPLPNCNSCCNLNILSDSVWCTGVNADGLQTYGYQATLTGCGTLLVQTNGGGDNNIAGGLSANSTYTFTAGNPLTITGSYTVGQGNDSTLCFTFIMESAAGLICADTTICLPLPNCNSCCNLNILSDSVWCTGVSADGLQTYGYQATLTGCGTLLVQTNGGGDNNIAGGLSANSTYTFTAGNPLTITGSYTVGQGNDSTLCFTFIMESAAGVICADTTICLPLPNCNTNCCYLNILSDSVWCALSDINGGTGYGYQVVVEGCGNLSVENTNGISTTYTLIPGSPMVITGSCTESQFTEGILCLSFVMSGGGVVCADTIICLPLPPCNNNCCYLNILSDSVWCALSDINGGTGYGYQVVVEGCGNLSVESTNGISTTYTLIPGNPIVITGSYTESQFTEGILCLSFVMSGGGVVCADTIICLPLPPCNKNCCYLNILSDSVWCLPSYINYGTSYGYQVVVEGCGNLTVESTNGNSTNYTLIAGNPTVISGSYTESAYTENILCLSFVVSGGGVVCADTIICLPFICPPLTLNAPANETVPACQTQAQVNAEFVAWLNSFTYSGGCNTTLSNNSSGAPSACGGSTTVEFTVSSSCSDNLTVSATFTVTAAPPLTLSAPANETVAACQTQTAVNTEFISWLNSLTYSGGCNTTLSNNSSGAPSACGGSTTVEFTVSSSCSENQTVSATFTVTAAPPLILSAPANETVAACQTQTAVNAEFVAWLNSFTYSGGCNTTLSNNSSGAPSACGGSTTVEFTVSSSCSDNLTVSATFTVTAAPPLTLSAPANETVAACQTQAAVNAEFVAWLNSFTYSGGCNTTLSNNSAGAPSACGGSTTVEFTVSSSCSGSQTVSASFIVTAAPPLTLSAPANETVAACQTQTAVNAEFVSWLNSLTYSGGCNTTLSNNSSGAPSACGGSTTVEFTVSSSCSENQTVSATFTVTAAPPLILSAPANETVAACQTQSQVNVEFATWLNSFSYSGGCNVTVSNNNTGAPSAHGGSVTVIFTATSNCQAPVSGTATFTVSSMSQITITASNDTLTCTNKNAVLTASGGGTYKWSTGATTAAITVTVPGTYTVTVTGTNGCTATASLVVNQNITPPSAYINPNADTLTCTNTSAVLAAIGGGTYSWSTGATGTSIIVSSPGTYKVTVTGSNGCTASASSVVTQNIKAPSASVSASVKTLTCSTPNAVLTASGGGTYLWNNGATTAAITISAAGTYTVTVTGSNGCTASASISIAQNINPPVANATASVDTLTCATTSVVLKATGGGTYSWNTGATTASITVSSAGTYTVTVTGSNGCTASASISVAQNNTVPKTNITASADTLTCTTKNAVLTASGGGSYKWSTGPATAAITVSAAGTYTVTVTGGNGCTAMASIVVNQNITPPSAYVNPNADTLTCTNTSAVLTASGNGTYSWSTGATSASITVSSPGNYKVTVTGSNGCTASASSVVTQNTKAPNVSVSGSVKTLTCSTPNAVLTANGGGTYLWNNGATTAAITISAAGAYTVTVTGSNGCTASASISIAQNITPPTVSVTANTDTLTCATTSVVLKANGGGTYSWNTGATTASITISSAGTYTVTVTGSNGCTASASISVAQNITVPKANITASTDTLTCTTKNAVLTASGGGTYKWSTGAGSASITVNTAGTYTVTVTGSNGCTVMASIAIAQNTTPPTVTVSPTAVALTCTITSATLTASGGGTYAWSTGATSASITVSSAGTYKVTVTGSNGCSTSSSAVVTQQCNTKKTDDINPSANNDAAAGIAEGKTDAPVDLNGDGEFMVKVYPNPFSSTLHLRVESSSEENLHLRIINTLGQLIEEKTTDSYYGTDITLGNDVVNGVYILEINQGENRKVLRIVKSE